MEIILLCKQFHFGNRKSWNIIILGDPGGGSQSRREKRTVLWNIHRAVSLAPKTASGSSRMKYDMNVVGKVTKNPRWFSGFWEAPHPLMYWNKEMQTFSPHVMYDNLRQSWFWIPCCGFRNWGTRFRIPCQWYLDSRFQSTLAGFRIPDSRLLSWIPDSKA